MSVGKGRPHRLASSLGDSKRSERGGTLRPSDGAAVQAGVATNLIHPAYGEPSHFNIESKEEPVQTFKAYRTFEKDDVVSSRFVNLGLDELDPGDVVVRTKYSTINYKDALSYGGAGKIMRKFPTVAGIDLAGTVESSNDTRWKRGDKVIVTGYDLGVSHDGGYAEYARVPADWIVRRPESMTAFDAMTIGTAGFTAALAIHLMQHNGLQPDNGRVAVTGATGGVGSVAIEILGKMGYHVVAITGKLRETA